MRVPLVIEYKDGTTEEVEAVFADFIGFERVWNRTMMKFKDEIRLTDLAWLAWSALTHRGLTRLKFDPEWIATVEMVSSPDVDAGKEIDTVLAVDEGAVVGEIPLSPVTDQHIG